MDTTLQEILKSPRLERYAAVIGETLADEVETYVLREQNGEHFFGSGGRHADGNLISVAVPGFSIPVRALFDPAEHAATMRRLVAGG